MGNTVSYGRFSLRSLFSGRLAGVWITLGVVIVGVTFALGALNITGDASRFPLAVGFLTVVLGMFEFIQELRQARGRPVESTEDAPVGAPGNWSEILRIAAWFAITIATVFLAGFLIASFVSATIYCSWIERVTPLRSLLRGGAFALVLWAMFDWLAGFVLYEGVFS